VHDEQCRQLLHVLTLAVIDQLASVLQEEERLTEAEALRRELSILSRQALGEGKSDYWSFQYKLGGLLAEQGKYAAAQVIFEKVIAFRGGKDREESVVGLMVNLGAALKEQGKLDDAEELLIDARRQAALMKDKLRFQLHATEALGDVCEAQGHPEKTKELYSSTLDTLKANFSMEDPLDLVWHVT
jgi:tetratricopeptide (TPR) repeat protein